MRVPVIVMGVALLGGCAAPPADFGPPHTVASRDKAAAVLVSPTMVAPWADVATALKPQFVLDGDKALPLVLPTTEGVAQSQVNAGQFSLGLTSPGATAGTPGAPPAGAGLPATSSPAAPGLDPVLKYKAAYYLNQTVQLLNQEIDHVVSRQCLVPYVVRLKLAVMPYQPGLAYTAHTHIAFFSGTTASGRAPDLPAGLASECSTPGAQRALPQVVPLLAADDLDVATRSQAAQTARQLGLALNAMVGGGGDRRQRRDLE